MPGTVSAVLPEHLSVPLIGHSLLSVDFVERKPCDGVFLAVVRHPEKALRALLDADEALP